MEIRTTRASGVFWIAVCILVRESKGTDGDPSTKLKTHVVFSPKAYKRLEEPLFLMERDKLVAHAFYASLQRQQLEREEQKRLKQSPQLPLFDLDADQ
jgi:hypothetical protein